MLEEAVAARDSLERVTATPLLVYARGEELTYVNHLVPAFTAYLQSEANDRRAAEELLSVVRRGRAHQGRAIEAMRIVQ